MTDSYIIIFSRRGVDRMVKSDEFSLKAGEYAVRVNLEVPDEVFEPIQIPTMVVSVPVEACRRPIHAHLEASEDSES